MSINEKKCGNCGKVYKSDKDFLKHTTRWRKCQDGNLWVNCDCDSTLILPKGKYDWYSPEKLMSHEAASAFNKLANSEEFPHLDTQVLKIMELLSKEDVSLPDLTQAIKSEPIIASHVLTTANNSKVAGAAQIDSIKHAIVYIGKESLQEIVLIAGIRKIDIDTITFVSEDYWNDSLCTGMIAEALVSKCTQGLIPDKAYVAGCLANIGKLVTAMMFPNEADVIVESMYGEMVPINWHLAEKDLDVPSHTVLGEIAAVMWGLPEYVTEICAHHHNQRKLFSSEHDMPMSYMDIVATATQINHIIQVESSLVQKETIGRFLQKSKMTRRQFDNFIVSIRNKIKSKNLAVGL